MAKCGRKKKPVLSLEEQEDAALEKLYEPCLDKDGNVYFERSDRTLQLDEIAVLLWMMEGRKTAKPMSKMGVEKILQKALMKIRSGLKEYGITCLDDVIDTHKRRKTLASKFDSCDGE